MFKLRLILSAILIVYLSFSNYSYCYDGIAEIGLNIIEAAVNQQNCNLVFGVYEDNTDEIVITDYDLDEITRFQIDYSPFDYKYSKNGEKLYICMMDLTDQVTRINAFLSIYDCSNWQETNRIELPGVPIEICVPIDNNIIYLTCGDEGSDIKLLKIDTSLNAGIVNRVDFGEGPACGIALNHEENKLYVHDNYPYGNFTEEFERTDWWYKMRIFNPETLGEINSINIKTWEVLDLIQGPQGYILISHGDPGNYSPEALSMWNTQTESIERKINIPGNIGCRNIIYDSLRNYVYAITFDEIEIFEPYSQTTIHEREVTNKIVRINLSNNSVSWFEDFPEIISPIAISPDFSRLYANTALSGSRKVYYLDL